MEARLIGIIALIGTSRKLIKKLIVCLLFFFFYI